MTTVTETAPARQEVQLGGRDEDLDPWHDLATSYATFVGWLPEGSHAPRRL